VSGDIHQVVYAREAGFTGQIVRDVGDGYRRNRIHDNVAVVHPVTATDLDTGGLPDTDAASDSSTPDSLSKAFGEHHLETRPTGLFTSARNVHLTNGHCGGFSHIEGWSPGQLVQLAGLEHTPTAADASSTSPIKKAVECLHQERRRSWFELNRRSHLRQNRQPSAGHTNPRTKSSVQAY
jgi:hypothetical protein